MTAAPTTRRRRSRFGYRPALDGVRGIAMVAFMAFHFGFTQLKGAWVCINLFFVLSAFLITRLLVEERERFGAIDVLGFYRRRARRLLPPLVLLLSALCVFGWFFAENIDRRPLRNDMLATMGFVQNWHLIAVHDQYFQTFDPSYLRQAWTLAVEEQFYIVVPLLLTALMWLRVGRRMRAVLLLLLGVASSVWTAHVGIATRAAQSHAYYGTDTRVQALCIGAALGVLVAPGRDGRMPWRPPRRVVVALGWLGLASAVYACVRVAPFTPWLFDGGGLYVFALGAAALVYACADTRTSLLHSILGHRSIAYLGRLSYSLYLWHWPIHLWLNQLLVGYPRTVKFAIGFCVTTLVAAASYRWVERPVMRGGLRALVPSLRTGRVVVAAVTACLVGAVFAVGSVPAAAVARSGPTVPLVSGTLGYHPHRHHVTIGVFGDSVPYLLVKRLPRVDYPDLTVENLAAPGCDLSTDSSVQWSPQWISAPDKRCRAAHRDLGTRLARDHAEVLTVFAGPTWAMPHKLASGRVVSLADRAYRTMITTRLTTLRRRAKAAGVRQMQLVNLPCRSTDPDAFYMPPGTRDYLMKHPEITRRVTEPRQLNTLLASWAHAHGVPVIDLHGRLCPSGTYEPQRNGVTLYEDGLHFTPAATRMIWTWLAPTIRGLYEHRDASGGEGSS